MNTPRRKSPRGASTTCRRTALGVTIATIAGCIVSLVGTTGVADASLEWPSSKVVHPETVSADAMPTVQIDGVVWAQEIVGNTVYVGGDFDNARPAGAAPGVAQTARSNFLAYDLTTGVLRSDINIPANGQIRTIERSPDGSRIYVGGDFTSLGGVSRARLAAIDTATNTVTGFAPTVGFSVYDVGVTASRVYFGGSFTNVNGQARSNLAAVDLNGALLPWAPVANAAVAAVQPSPDATKIAIGGRFEVLNGSTDFRGLAFVDATTGANRPMGAAARIRNGGDNGGITSLESDGDLLFGTAYCFGANCGTMEGRFAAEWDDGAIRWVDDCHGDSYSIHPAGAVVYAVSHSHYCGNIGGWPETEPQRINRANAMTREPAGLVTRDRLNYTSWSGQPRPDILNFFPVVNAGTYTGQNQGAWHVTGNARYVLIGGEFTTVNGVAQQGLVRFQSRAFAANDQGPRLGTDAYPIRVRSDATGLVTLSWQANEDRDDADLSYRVQRRRVGTTTVTLLHERTAVAPFWNRQVMNFTDRTGAPGDQYEYRVQVTDGYGNFANSNWVATTVASGGARSGYLEAVLASQPDSLWRLDESSGSAANDWVGWRNGTRVGGVTANVSGGVAGGRANTFDGSTGSFIRTDANEYPPHAFTLEAWFRGGSGASGLLIGFNSSNSGAGSGTLHDRHLYMDTSGRIQFGLNADTAQSIASPNSYRDNSWHHAVATVGANGMQLFIDGRRVANRTDVSNGRTGYFGYWRIGGGAMDSFQGTDTGAGRWFNGQIDEVALYKQVLSCADVVSHYSAAGFPPPNSCPTPNFSYAIRQPGDGRLVDFDARQSVDADGSIVNYRWNFGDGSGEVAGTSPTTSHQFPGIGTYSVTLTITDNAGNSSSTFKSVTTADPTTLPQWTDQTIGPLRVGIPFNDAVAATATPPPTYSLVDGTLPTGLEFDPVTGGLTGTPTVVGAYSFTVRAGNGLGSVTATLSGFVSPAVDPQLVIDVGAAAGSAATGAPVNVTGQGFAPGTTVTLTLDGQPLGNGLVGGDQAVVIDAVLPAVVTGVHTLVATGTAAEGNVVQTEQEFVVDWVGSLGATPNGAGYQGIQPKRVLDTRLIDAKLAAGAEHRLAIDDSWGVPGDTVSVVLNVTATEPEDGGFLTVYPCGTQRPLASVVNYQASQTVPNLVVVPIGELREICIYSLAASHVIADLNGYFAPSAPARIGGGQPVRLVDTRDTTKLGAGQVLEVQVTGEGRAPQGAQSAVINVTVTQPEAAGFLTLYPCDQAMPTASNVNYAADQTVANQAFVTLSASGTACVYTLAPAHVVLDLNAWFRVGETPELVSVVPVRVLDTRNTAKIQAGETIELPLAGAGGIGGATGFAVNTTIAEPEGPGFVTFFPCGQEMPEVSSINFTSAGQVVANHTTAVVGANGATCIFASTTTHVVVDVEGAYISFG